MRVLRAKRVILLIFLISGCQSHDTVPKTSGAEYFPMQVDASWIYDVVETHISQVNGQTNEFYELRLRVTDSFVTSGETTYIIERSRRTEPEDLWTNLDTWSVRLNAFQAVLQEGNIPFIKFQFPLTEGKSWNGNALNNLGGTEACADGSFECDNYKVENLGKAFDTQGLSYVNSVTIVENNEDDPIVMMDVRKSTYAAAVGLIYQEVSQLEYCTVGSCIGQKVVENGTLFRQKLKSYAL